MNDLINVKASRDRITETEGVDPLVPQAAADAPGTELCRAAFKAILDGELPVLSELAKSASASSQDLEQLVGRALIIDENGRVVAAHGLSAVPARQHRLEGRGTVGRHTVR